YAQIAADYLGCPIEDIDVVEGDTDRIPYGNGTWGDRSLVTAGAAVKIASERVILKGKRLAAHLLECAAEDLDYANGHYVVRGTDRMVPFAEVARQAYLGANYPSSGFELGLEETAVYDQPMEPSPAAPTSAAAHLAVVIVDADTGCVALRDFYAVDDCGTTVNPVVDALWHLGVRHIERPLTPFKVWEALNRNAGR